MDKTTVYLPARIRAILGISERSRRTPSLSKRSISRASQVEARAGSGPDGVLEHIELRTAQVHGPDRIAPGGDRRLDFVDDDLRRRSR